MKTTSEITEFIKNELDEAKEKHGQTEDRQEMLYHVIRIATLEQILHEIAR